MEMSSLEKSRRHGMIVLDIIWLILPSIAIGLRIWSRLTMRTQRFWWDDWCIIAALVRITTRVAALVLGLTRKTSRLP